MALTYTRTAFNGASSYSSTGGTYSYWYTPFTSRATTAGNVLVAICSTNYSVAPTALAANGWTLASSGTNSSSVGASVLTKTATGSDTLNLNCTFSSNVQVVLFEISGATTGSVKAAEVAATGVGQANADPPSVTFYASGENEVWAVRCAQASAAAPTAAPSGYSNLTSTSVSGYPNITHAEKDVASGTSENPGTFTSTSCYFVAFTISVGVKDTTPPTITSASSGSTVQGVDWTLALTANETSTWSLDGGTDQSSFTISSSTLKLSSPASVKSYVVIVRCTDTAGNYTDQTITVTVGAKGDRRHAARYTHTI